MPKRKAYFRRWGVRQAIDRQLTVITNRMINQTYSMKVVDEYMDAVIALKTRRYRVKCR